MSFFRLNTQETEEKIVDRKERIFSDIKIIGTTNNDTFLTPINTTAPSQKIRFFLDAIEVITGEILPIGQYIELESQQVFTYKVNNQLYTFSLVQNMNLTTKILSWRIRARNGAGSTVSVKLYVSSVNFIDSFYNDNLGFASSGSPNLITNYSYPMAIGNIPGGAFVEIKDIKLANKPVFLNLLTTNLGTVAPAATISTAFTIDPSKLVFREISGHFISSVDNLYWDIHSAFKITYDYTAQRFNFTNSNTQELTGAIYVRILASGV